MLNLKRNSHNIHRDHLIEIYLISIVHCNTHMFQKIENHIFGNEVGRFQFRKMYRASFSVTMRFLQKGKHRQKIKQKLNKRKHVNTWTFFFHFSWCLCLCNSARMLSYYTQNSRICLFSFICLRVFLNIHTQRRIFER